VDHSSDDRWLNAVGEDLARSDPRWSRRWRLGQALLPGRSPSWSALAASGALLVVAAALLLISVGSGQRWMLLLAATVFAIGMRPVARGLAVEKTVAPGGAARRAQGRCRART
jgi:hypothetical protein